MKNYFFAFTAKDVRGNTQMGNFEAKTDQLTWDAICGIVKLYCEKRAKEDGIFMKPHDFCITFFHELEK
jgi:hypothetical protein